MKKHGLDLERSLWFVLSYLKALALAALRLYI